jgi:hypothetical protein
MDEFEFDEFLRIAMPALEAVDSIRLLDLLSKKLDRAVKASKAEPYPGYSSVWCRDLDQPDPVDGVLAQLARAVAGIAVRASTSAESTERVFAILDRYELEIFARIRLRVLAAAGPFVRDRLDSFLRDRASVEPSFRGRETAAVVREQFENASEDARLAFQHAVEAGPADKEIERPDAEKERAERKGSWQRRRLLWFRGRIPASLRDLATRVGVTGEQPSPEAEGLAEDGFYVSGGFIGERSPISVERLAAFGPKEFVDYLVTWRPELSSWTSPTNEGLERIIGEYAATRPDEALARARLLAESPQGAAEPHVPAYVQALFGGVRRAAEAGTAVDWPEALRLIGDLLPRIDQEISREEKGNPRRPWRWLATEIVDLLIAASRSSSIPFAQTEALWAIVDQIIRSAHTWEADDGEPFKSFEDVLTAALNTAAGRATEALMEAALATYRNALGVPEVEATAEQVEAAKAVVAPRLRPLVQHVLAQAGRGALAARAVVGTYVPQIHLLDRAWLMDAAAVIFENGASEPLSHPTWGAYLTRARLYSDVFPDLRRWYVAAAASIPQTLRVSSDRHWSLTQHLAEHIFWAYARGLIEITDDDRLLSTVFELVPTAERAHISWEVFRAFTDAKEPVPNQLAERVVRFWRWRLECLEQLPESDSRQEEFSGLTWLVCTPSLSDGDVLDLGLRTIEGSRGDAAARGTIWDRVGRLADADIDKAFRIAELLITAALGRPHPHVTLQQTERVLGRALAAGSAETRERGRRLVHTLGDRGYVEFGRLLGER